MSFQAQITFLPSRDLEASHGFYSGVLGLSMCLDQGACRLYRVGAGSYLGFCAHSALMNDPDRVVLTLVTPDVDGWHARLVGAGVSVDGVPRANERFGIYHFYAFDPDGYRVEFQRFDDPNWGGRNRD